MPPATRLGDLVECPDDWHGTYYDDGWTCCSHYVSGGAASISQGSPNVFVNGKPIVRLSDTGNHAQCCGPNTFTHVRASTTVFVNGRGVVRIGDMTQHCGGVGSVRMGSPNVIIGG